MPRKSSLGVMSDRMKRARMAAWSPEDIAKYAALPPDQKASYWFLVETKAHPIEKNVFHRIGDWFNKVGNSASLPNFTGK